ncbi:hypothetical protein [Chitinophaga japonensis]|uniref:Uncharacterized protein n=1 Tax=Chitinophaga japonensis TaxID=104662 RepID=A0A562T0A5_CHIJA|nr:hypothetical protein [Chitinophaga japonensis]TWI86440.1 hypothetical protein LX66_3697 [Chitinophaga japonensis]
MNKIKIEKASLYKLGMTICLAMIISMFLFACGSSRNSGTGEDMNDIDTSSDVIQDTSGAMRDTSMYPDTSSMNRVPPEDGGQ